MKFVWKNKFTKLVDPIAAWCFCSVVLRFNIFNIYLLISSDVELSRAIANESRQVRNIQMYTNNISTITVIYCDINYSSNSTLNIEVSGLTWDHRELFAKSR